VTATHHASSGDYRRESQQFQRGYLHRKRVVCPMAAKRHARHFKSYPQNSSTHRRHATTQLVHRHHQITLLCKASLSRFVDRLEQIYQFSQPEFLLKESQLFTERA
jgi:hypothetical protein